MNVLLSMFVTPVGIVMLVSETDPENAPLPILVIPEGME